MDPVTQSDAMIPPPPQEPVLRHRQLRLFELGNPLAARLGAGFFQSLPRQPGVYFFYDAQERLLYIGQSSDLRARVGSYRHVCPECHPRRTLRLVHRLARVEIRLCATHAEAQALEAALLLEHRPPYNRAGVWQAPPWWLSLHPGDAAIQVRLTRASAEGAAGLGPLPASFRYVHAALMRCLLRCFNPGLDLANFPVGMLGPTIPLVQNLPLAAGKEDAATEIAGFATRSSDALLARLESVLSPAHLAGPLEQAFWAEQLEYLRKFYHNGRPGTALLNPSLPADLAELRLFPALDRPSGAGG